MFKWFSAMLTKKEQSMFGKWLDTLIEKRGLDTERVFEVEGDSRTNFVSLATVIEQVKVASFDERHKVKDILSILIKKGPRNDVIMSLFKRLAGAVAM